jgi:hypothetical protein
MPRFEARGFEGKAYRVLHFAGNRSVTLPNICPRCP